MYKRQALELDGTRRAALTVEDVMALFRQKTSKALDNDRMLLQAE